MGPPSLFPFIYLWHTAAVLLRSIDFQEKCWTLHQSLFKWLKLWICILCILIVFVNVCIKKSTKQNDVNLVMWFLRNVQYTYLEELSMNVLVGSEHLHRPLDVSVCFSSFRCSFRCPPIITLFLYLLLMYWTGPLPYLSGSASIRFWFFFICSEAFVKT